MQNPAQIHTTQISIDDDGFIYDVKVSDPEWIERSPDGTNDFFAYLSIPLELSEDELKDRLNVISRNAIYQHRKHRNRSFRLLQRSNDLTLDFDHGSRYLEADFEALDVTDSKRSTE